MNASAPNSKDSNAGLAVWHPTAAGGKSIRAQIKSVPANHRCRSAAGAPGRIVADYELLDAANNKAHALDSGANVEIEVGYTPADLKRAGGKTANLVLMYWDEAHSTWVRFTSAAHGFQLVVDSQKYPDCLGYGHVDKNVPFDPPTGWGP